MKEFTLYGLKRSDEETIRYIGITSETLELRLKRHLRDGQRNPHKGNWIKKTKREGAHTEIVPYAVGMTFEDACDLEIFVIKELRAIGYPLLNISNGGEAPMFGRKATPEHLEKLRVSHLGIKQSEETRVKRGFSLLGNSNNGKALHKGIYKRSGCPKRPWMARITFAGVTKNLGYFETAEKAGEAYKNALDEIRKNYENQNS